MLSMLPKIWIWLKSHWHLPVSLLIALVLFILFKGKSPKRVLQESIEIGRARQRAYEYKTRMSEQIKNDEKANKAKFKDDFYTDKEALKERIKKELERDGD